MSENKEVIFLAYANSIDNPLPNLSKEDKTVYNVLAPRIANGDFIVHRDSSATRDNIVENLKSFKDDIIIFQYSGHAGNDEILLEDDIANPSGIFGLLAKCPKLQMIILNGCSTSGQIALILEKVEEAVVIISTSAPIDDELATYYSIHFWTALCKENASFEQAHKTALDTIEIYKKNEFDYKDYDHARNVLIVRKEAPENDQVWGIFSVSKGLARNKLPKNQVIADNNVNQFLIDKLFPAFSKYSPAVKTAWEDESLDMNYKITELLQALPLPISDQLRKLFARRSARDFNSEHKFYNKLGEDRLHQIIATYETLVETLGFIHLAQLWDASPNKIKISEEQLAFLKQYYYASSNEDKNQLSFIHLSFTINEILSKNNIENFLEEWNDTALAISPQNGLLKNTIHALQALVLQREKNKLKSKDIKNLCLEAEEHLANLYAIFAFIVKYKMTSVKGINVKKYRHQPTTKYNHKVIYLIQQFDTFDKQVSIKDYETEDPIFTDAVFLAKENGDYLNLTPFIIDENSFNPKAPLAKICHFDLYEDTSKGEIYTFTHVYNRKDQPLFIHKDKTFEIIKEQFSHFKSAVLKDESLS